MLIADVQLCIRLPRYWFDNDHFNYSNRNAVVHPHSYLSQKCIWTQICTTWDAANSRILSVDSVIGEQQTI